MPWFDGTVRPTVSIIFLTVFLWLSSGLLGSLFRQKPVEVLGPCGLNMFQCIGEPLLGILSQHPICPEHWKNWFSFPRWSNAVEQHRALFLIVAMHCSQFWLLQIRLLYNNFVIACYCWSCRRAACTPMTLLYNNFVIACYCWSCRRAACTPMTLQNYRHLANLTIRLSP